MKRLAGVLATILFLSSCGAQQPTSQPATLQPQTFQLVSEERRVITVTASEEVRVEPDMAEVVCMVSTEAVEAEHCRQQNSETVAAVLEAVTALGIEEKSIQTTDLNLYPRYDWSKSRATLIGYEMSTTLTISDIPIDLVGTLITKAVQAGANNVQSVSYLASQYDDAYQQALGRAIQAARTKAEAMAAAGNCTLGCVANMQEHSNNDSARYTYYDLDTTVKALMEETETAVQPGELRVSARVTVEFSLEY